MGKVIAELFPDRQIPPHTPPVGELGIKETGRADLPLVLPSTMRAFDITPAEAKRRVETEHQLHLKDQDARGETTDMEE